MIHPEFTPALDQSDHAAGQSTRAWMNRYKKTLESQGHRVEFFSPRDSKLTSFDWVHFFSRWDGETWKSIQAAGLKVLVIPALPGQGMPKIRRGNRILHSFFLGALALRQRNWPPITAKNFLALADGYLILKKGDWHPFLAEEMNLKSSQRIRFIDSEPENAAWSSLQLCLGEAR